jgi:N-acetylglucosamine-6-sulfatase
LGQFRMPICKLHPYENDIRVPMMMRGPGIAKNTTTSLVSTHVNLMPTLMGLATKKYDSQDVVPSTMDGMNLAAKILNLEGTIVNEKDKTLSTTESSSVLVEYASLGNLALYNHLVDTFNHSFVALRILDTDPAHYPLHNLKYVEFRDSREDWNMTKKPLERELYNVEFDPFEMHNIVEEVSPVLVEALSEKIQKMIQCQGAMCREEHLSGLEAFWSSSLRR